jgi:hypothetical protein
MALSRLVGSLLAFPEPGCLGEGRLVSGRGLRLGAASEGQHGLLNFALQLFKAAMTSVTVCESLI